MPHLIGLPGRQQPIRLDAEWFFHWRSGLVPGLFHIGFAQQTLNRGSADLESRPQQMPGDGARAEFPFRQQPSQFLRGLADGVIHAVPYDRAVQQTGAAFSFHRFDPRTNGVGMHDKTPGSGFDIPVA